MVKASNANLNKKNFCDLRLSLKMLDGRIFVAPQKHSNLYSTIEDKQLATVGYE
jgi:hypothetical protein